MKGIGLENVYIVSKRKHMTTKMLLKRNNSTNMIRVQQRKKEDYNSNMKNVKDIGLRKEGNYGRFEEENGLIQPNEGTESIRSFNDEAANMTSERASSVDNDTDRELNSFDDDSFEDEIGGKILKNNELKDDKQIVKQAAQNEKYNLVERPRFLFSFDLRDQENSFLHSLLRQNYSLEVFQLVSKLILDIVIVEALVYTYVGNDKYYFYFIVFLSHVTFEIALLYYMRKLT